MTIVNSDDIDRQMGRYIDPRSVPTHNGGDEVDAQVERGHFDGNSETVTGHSQTDLKGSAVFDHRELPSNERFGSTTVISINEAPPLDAQLDPRVQAQARAAAKAVPVQRPQAPPQPKPVHQPTLPRTLHPLLNKIPVKGTQPPPKPVPPPPAAPVPVQHIVNGQVVTPHTPQATTPPVAPSMAQILRPRIPAQQPMKAVPAPVQQTPAQQLAAGKPVTMAQILARRPAGK